LVVARSTAFDPGLGWRCAARLDRRRGHRHRSGPPATSSRGLGPKDSITSSSRRPSSAQFLCSPWVACGDAQSRPHAEKVRAAGSGRPSGGRGRFWR
jgi:hypothetical protein